MTKMYLGQLLGEYLDSTTIHGFTYIHGREHWASRMLWVYYLLFTSSSAKAQAIPGRRSCKST